MLKLFRRTRPAARPAARRPRLGFDALESRDCPTAWDVPLPPGVAAADLPPGSGPALLSGPPATSAAVKVDGNAAPRIVNFDVQAVGGGVYVFTGQVQDEFPGGLVVVFDGIPTLEGAEVVTDANGEFTLTVVLQTDGTDAGDVSVGTTDDIGQPSNRPVVTVNPRG